MAKERASIGQLKDLMAQVPITRPGVKSRLLLIVEFDSMPEREYLDEVVQKCQEQGGVELAEYYHLAPAVESLI